MAAGAKTAQTPREKMTAFADAQPLSTLCMSLFVLGAKPELDEAERLTHAVIIGAICKKCPAADAAFDAWAESVDDERTAVQVIVAAAMGA